MKPYSNDISDHRSVVAWRDAAMTDGWKLESVYSDEPAISYGRITKDGYKGNVCARVTSEMKTRIKHHTNKWAFNSEIHLWGPDGLAITAPFPYSWSAILSNATKCDECEEVGVVTLRVAFCQRVCATCLPTARAKYETPGWCD